MPSRKKSKKLKQLEDKLRIIRKEQAKRKKKTTSPEKKRRKPTKSPHEECLAMLERMKKLQYCSPFLEPVDWKRLNIPSYPKLIPYPMDLSTVERKCRSGEYRSPYAFAKDMRLIYQNAQTFNKVGTVPYNLSLKYAKKFEEEFERRIVEVHEQNEFTRNIAKVVSNLQKHPDSVPFRMPVNPKVLDIPDYHEVIESPMDLGTIFNKIDSYTHFKHFVADLFLVWDNCCRYNPKQNGIHQTALKLREYTNKQLDRNCQRDYEIWKDESYTSPTPYPVSSLTMNSSSTNDHMIANEHQSNTRITIAPGPSGVTMQSDSDPNGMDQDEDPLQSAAAKPSQAMEQEQEEEQDIFAAMDAVDDEESVRMMIQYLLKKSQLNEGTESLSLQQKEELQRGIACLESDYFDPLIGMLQRFIPEGEGDDDEVELDVDSIDDPLQVKMYNYMVKAIRQQEEGRQVREGGGSGEVIDHTQHQGMGQSPNQAQDERMENHQNNQITGNQVHEANIETSNAMDVDDDQDHGTNNNNSSNPMQNHVTSPSEDTTNHLDALSQERTEQSNSVGPNVVTAFPTTASPEKTNDAQDSNDGQFEFGSMDNVQSEQDQQDDGDVDMNGNDGGDHGDDAMNEEQGGGLDDVLGDIANAVESGATTSNAMPGLESSTTGTDPENEENTNQNEEEAAQETVSLPVIIPTMPELHRDDNATDSVQSAVNNDDAETPTGDNANDQTLTPQKAMTPQKEDIGMGGGEEKDLEQMEPAQGLNVMDAMQQEQEEMEQQAIGDDEDVDTPLADEIDF